MSMVREHHTLSLCSIMLSPFRVFREGAQHAERLCKKAPHPRAISLAPRQVPISMPSFFGSNSVGINHAVSCASFVAYTASRHGHRSTGSASRSSMRKRLSSSTITCKADSPSVIRAGVSSRDSGCPPFCSLPCNLGAGVSNCRGAPIARARPPRGVSTVDAYASRDY